MDNETMNSSKNPEENINSGTNPDTVPETANFSDSNSNNESTSSSTEKGTEMYTEPMTSTVMDRERDMARYWENTQQSRDPYSGTDINNGWYRQDYSQVQPNDKRWQGSYQQQNTYQQNTYQQSYNTQRPEYAYMGDNAQQSNYTRVPAQSESFGSGSASETTKNAAQTAKKKKAKHPKKSITFGKAIAVALICLLLGGAAGAVCMNFFGGSSDVVESGETDAENEDVSGEEDEDSSGIQVSTRDPESSATVSSTSKVSDTEMTMAEVYAANVNSTVGIQTTVTTNYFGFQTDAAASGSGFIITADGYILTNYHVIEDSNSISVSLNNGDEFDATLVGYDESNDIAVLKIEASYELDPVILGDSDAMNVGDAVVAIGNPLGELTFSLTHGVVSGLGREITLETGTTMKLIQTDCAINSGNSGGALFNLYGEVIGITNAKYSSSGSSDTASIDNLGFAIPINSIRSIVESIIENGVIVKPYIGVTVQNVDSTSQNYGLPAGAAVQSVTEGAPADEAGLEVNDIITAANGTTVESSSDLVDIISSLSPGDVVKLTVYRQGETLEIDVTVGENTTSALPVEEETTTDDQQSEVDGNYGNGYGNGYGYGFGYPWG